LIRPTKQSQRHNWEEKTMRRTLLSWCRVRFGLVVLVGVASLTAPANASNPHLVKADPMMGEPIFVSPSLTWDTGLIVPFKIAGLGKNEGLDVTLDGTLTIQGDVDETTTGISLTLTYADGSIELSGGITAFTIALTAETTLTSDKNGQVSGALVIPASINASFPDAPACVQAEWTQITLTFNGQTVALPDVVSGGFDSTGSFCS
jgi:hypothetical protein